MGDKEKLAVRSQYWLTSKNPAFQKAMEFCERVADSSANILLIGESGSGKEVAAKYIHACSRRSSDAFVAVNCTAYSESLLESELFGHEQGAFTGASKARTGKFELAHHGTLFLDEIGDLSLTIQTKLLRTLETKQIEKIGSNIRKDLDFHLITATNQDLPSLIDEGLFRADFFYRISTIAIYIPSLRERPEDLPDLIAYFLDQAQEENHITIRAMHPKVREFLQNYDYPGNIRELKNIIERMVILSDHGKITEDALPILCNIGKKDRPAASREEICLPKEILSWKEYKTWSETAYLKWVLRQCDDNVAEAARRLGISSRQIFNKIQEYHLR